MKTDTPLSRSAFLASATRHAAIPVFVGLGRVMLACMVLGGCKLVDQRTFDSAAGRPPVPHVKPARPGPAAAPPLALVRFQAAPETWQPGLTDIVRLALSRKPLALFRVQTLVPATGTPDAQARSLAEAGGTGGRQVAETIIAAGASSGQVEMSAMTDASVTTPEVRVYVK
ncbi:MAG: hypothetical protein ACRYGI_10990 [Janthinobacterium lividum]